jgi:hypothetical protein
MQGVEDSHDRLVRVVGQLAVRDHDDDPPLTDHAFDSADIPVPPVVILDMVPPVVLDGDPQTRVGQVRPG